MYGTTRISKKWLEWLAGQHASANTTLAKGYLDQLGRSGETSPSRPIVFLTIAGVLQFRIGRWDGGLPMQRDNWRLRCFAADLMSFQGYRKELL
jgi:hypothetical protein